MDAGRKPDEVKAHNQARMFMQDTQDWLKVLILHSNNLTDSWSKEETKFRLKEFAASVEQFKQTINAMIEKYS